MGMTVAEKILSRASGVGKVKAGDVVEPNVDLAMSHENGALVINQFLEIYKGTSMPPKIWDPSKLSIIFDHRVPAESPKTATNQKKIREFVSDQKIGKFHKRNQKYPYINKNICKYCKKQGYWLKDYQKRIINERKKNGQSEVNQASTDDFMLMAMTNLEEQNKT